MLAPSKIMFVVAPRNLSTTRSGPGLLVAWSAVAGAEAYVVSRARKDSLSFFPLETGCCPTRYEDFAVPCCPVASSSTSLQVEGLEPGMTYRFRVLAVGAISNATSAPSEPIVAPALPGPPEPPNVTRNDAGIVDLRWGAADSGGAPILGYRVVAVVQTIVWAGEPAAWRELVRNTSSPVAGLDELALLPSARYSLAVQAINSVGARLFLSSLPSTHPPPSTHTRTHPPPSTPLPSPPPPPAPRNRRFSLHLCAQAMAPRASTPPSPPPPPQQPPTSSRWEIGRMRPSTAGWCASFVHTRSGNGANPHLAPIASRIPTPASAHPPPIPHYPATTPPPTPTFYPCTSPPPLRPPGTAPSLLRPCSQRELQG